MLTLPPSQFDPDYSLFRVTFSDVRVNQANYTKIIKHIRGLFDESAAYAKSFTTAELIMAFSTYFKQASPNITKGPEYLPGVFDSPKVSRECIGAVVCMKLHALTPTPHSLLCSLGL